MAAVLVVCCSRGRDLGKKGDGQATRALTAGDTVDGGYMGIVRVQSDVVCSGVLLTNQWVLTASHCLRSDADGGVDAVSVSFGGTRSMPEQRSAADTVVRSRSDLNLALIRLASPFRVSPSIVSGRGRMYPNPAAQLVGQLLTCTGWGVTSERGRESDEPTWASLTVVSASGGYLRLRPGTRGQQVSRGDAGGPCFHTIAETVFVATAIVGKDGNGDGIGVDLAQQYVRTWTEQTLFQRGSDLLVAASSTPAAAVNGSRIDLLWVTANGSLQRQDAWTSDAPISLGRPEDAPFANQTPAAIVPRFGALHTYGVTAEGRGYELVVTSQPESNRWSLLPAAPGALSGLAVSSWDRERLDLFSRAESGAIIHNFFDSAQWWSWEDLRGDMDSDPTVVSWGPSRIDVFATGSGHVLHKWYGGGAWWPSRADWEDMGGTFTSAPAVVSLAPGSLDLFARGSNGRLMHRWFDYVWVDTWIDTGLDIPGAPVAAAVGGRISIFARNPDGTIWRAAYPR